MVFWNSPDKVEEHWVKACDCALNIQARLVHLNKQWKLQVISSGCDLFNLTVNQGIPTIRSRIGLHTAFALTGNIGSPEKMKYGDIAMLSNPV